MTIVDTLRQKGVTFGCLMEPMDTTSPHGELIFNLLASLAQYERALIQEHILAGLQAAK